MFFNSFQFAGFFAIVWLTCALLLRPKHVRALFPSVPRRSVLLVRNAFLLVVSYVFYAAWDWRFLGLLMASTANDYLVGVLLSRSSDPRRRRLYLTLSLAGNLGLLGFFKYYGFFATSLQALLGRFGIRADLHVLNVVLPVGIIFYTFQSLSYTIDVYRGVLRPERNPLNFATVVAFCPQLVAGPIERPHRLLPQFRHLRPITWPKVSSGSYLMAVGLFKKVVIAETVAKVADAAFDLNKPTGVQVAVGIYAFAFQIYADFSAYSDIARGAARCLGFELSRNFDMPYFSATPSEFWRRWHISLSTWLRDYLYISLGGNRGGTLKTYRNLMLTMLLGGLWHGAAWTFVVWGGIHGLVLCIYRAVEDPVRRFATRFPAAVQGALRVVAVVFFFQIVCLAWLFFRANDFSQAMTMLHALFAVPTPNVGKALGKLGPVMVSAALVASLLAVQLLQYWKRDSWLVFRSPAVVSGPIYAVAALIFIWIGDDGGESFIYFQF